MHGSFDLEGHRGTRGLHPGNTLAAFGKALEIGVTTLELDTGVTKDGVVVVSHDRRISPPGCHRPWVGSPIHDLTYAQIQGHLPSLSQVFELTNCHGAYDVRFDIETKIDPRVDDTVDPVTFAHEVLGVIRRYGMAERSVLQSFDWRTLVEAKGELPALETGALAQASTIFPGTPWTAGVPIGADAWSAGTLARAVKSIGASVVSANYPDITDALVAAAHAQSLRIIPWTVDDAPTMTSLIDRGVDGLITDYPMIARGVMAQRGIELPRPYGLS